MGTELAFEEFHEGGENRHVWRLPTGLKHPPLELKRGIGSSDSDLVKWCKRSMEGIGQLRIATKSVEVSLMDCEGRPVRSWYFADAFPIKWEFDAFNATKNEVAIEKISLSYSYSYRME